MKKILLIISLVLLFAAFSCKTSTTASDDFRLITVSGFSLQDTGPEGLTSINLFFSLNNRGNLSGTIKSWNFKLMHNIITLLEINNGNYRNYNLELSDSTSVPSNNILNFYVNTPLPLAQNAVGKDSLPFSTYTPNGVIVELTIEDSSGELFTITKRGSYTYERGIIDGEKYNILGSWEFTKTINGDTKAKQKITFVGTKSSGNFVVYNLGTGKAENSGTFVVSGYTSLTLNSSNGTKFWGNFTSVNSMDGTLLKGTSTGTWSASR